MKTSIFQTLLLVGLGFILVLAVLIFSGLLPGFRAKPIGQAATVTIWGTSQTLVVTPFLEKLNKKVEKSYRIVYREKDEDTINEDLLEALASGQGPDVVILPAELIFQNRNKLQILPLANFSERQYLDTFVDVANLFKTTTGWLALPVAVDPLVLYYNKDLYKLAGLLTPLANWEELVLQQPKLTSVDELQRLKQSAVAFGSTNNVNNFKEIMSLFLLQSGIRPISLSADVYQTNLTKTKVDQSFKPVELALDFFNQFADPVRSTYTWSRSRPEARDAFALGELANYFGLASELPTILNQNPHLDFDVASVPRLNQDANLTYGRLYGLAVLKSSPRQAQAFIAAVELTLADHDGGEWSDLMGLTPVRRDILAKPADNPYRAVFNREALTTVSWPDPDQVKTRAVFKEMIDDASTGRLSTGGAVSKADKALQLIINNSR